jgi:rhodanese-related sulfurtransferase
LAIKLRGLGFKNPIVLSGGMAAWQTAQLPTVKGK